MSFLKKIFGKKDEPINNYADFWAWFQKNEKQFFQAVKKHQNIEKEFFDKLSPKLEELKEGYFYLTGMADDHTAELVLTADGNTKNIVFVEELVEQAPVIAGWKFTSLKPPLDIKNVSIRMGGYQFNSDNLYFYSNELADYRDEIDISIVHNDLTEENRELISRGIYIFLDNYLGELDFANNIDSLSIMDKKQAEKELIPIEKLKDFLSWRQKEFVEKYDGVRYNTDQDEHSILEADLENGGKLIAVVNSRLLEWDSKASHPWIAAITFKYDGSDNNGMPDNDDYESLNQIDDSIQKELSDKDGYLYIGRQTANSERVVYFACKDFRRPSKVFYKIQQDHGDEYEIEYSLYKDKYWQSFERFRVH